MRRNYITAQTMFLPTTYKMGHTSTGYAEGIDLKSGKLKKERKDLCRRVHVHLYSLAHTDNSPETAMLSLIHAIEKIQSL